MVAFFFFPIMIAFILSVNKSKKILIVYCLFPLFFIILFFVPGAFSIEQFGTIDTRNMLIGFNSLTMGLRNDGLILLLFFPTLFLLINKSRNHFRYANFLLISITIMMLIPPLISGVADYTNQPYRLIPFITMFSISFGYLFSKKINQISTK
jgi:ABC-type spermidine/putrescine transport system permease subunit II